MHLVLQATLAVATSALVFTGCADSSRDRAWIADELARRGASSAGDESDTERRLASGLDEDDVVAIALANSPAYRIELARLDSARADLSEARRPANPQLTVMGAFGPVNAIATLLAPLESLWQIPRRSAAAAREVDAVAQSLVQVGLDLARDARIAHVELGLAEDRLRIRTELGAIGIELRRIADARLREGETLPSEAAIVAADARVADDAIGASTTERLVAMERLRALLGLERDAGPIAIRFGRVSFDPPEYDALIAIARSSRPDVLAAESSLDAAMARAGWERSRIVSVAAQVEAQWSRPDVRAARVGGRVELPIFGANPGGRGRAAAEVERAHARIVLVRQRVVLDVIEARARLVQARTSLDAYRSDVLVSLDEARRVVVMNYELGDETYLVVLDALRRIGDARLREAELVAAERRAAADLERAIGARIEGTSR